MFASRECRGLPRYLRPVRMRRRGLPQGRVCIGGGGMFASGGEKGAGVLCAGVCCAGPGACLRMRVGYAAGASRVRVA